MLQRAASNAYSWWWLNIDTWKITDAEEMVTNMSEIIDNDGDPFKAELISTLEEIFQSYRWLTEKFDHLSKDLKSDNRTIASVFPDRVPYAMEDEDDDNFNQTSTSSIHSNKPRLPKGQTLKKDFRNRSMLLSKEGQLKNAVRFQTSGLNKDEALEEIDKLQKEMLALQTEREEFMKSSYEYGYKKFKEIENQITEKQKRVCDLQDEFGIRSVIDNNEGRSLMANQALKSCQESLNTLKEKHELSSKVARAESRRIKHVNHKFEALRNKFNSPQTNQQEKHKRVSSTAELDNMAYDIDNESQDLEALQKENEEKLQVDLNESLTMPELVKKIDDLVKRVIRLEAAVFSEKALIKRLKSEADELQEQVKTLEEDKETIDELEGELSRVKDLVKTVLDQNNSLKTHFTEAICNVNHLSVKLHELEAIGLDAKADRGTEEYEILPAPDHSSPLKDTGTKLEEDKNVSAEGENNVDDESSYNKADGDSEKVQELEGKNKAEKEYLPETESIVPDTELEELESDEEEQPNWRKKLNDVDKKNRDSFLQMALQIKELKYAVVVRDQEIHSLRQRLCSVVEYNKDGESVEHEGTQRSTSPESNLTEFIHPSPIDEETDETVVEQTAQGRFKESAKKMGEQIKSDAVSEIEDKIRSGIDDLLEENLVFWLRFSTSIHQIQKYQTSVKDLKAELSKLREKIHQEGSGGKMKSEVCPIFSHLREIKTELTLWLENNEVLKDEVQDRHFSLCNFQDEIARVTNVTNRGRETGISEYQAAKFQGEVLNMKQEIKKVGDELNAGFTRAGQLKQEVEKITADLEKELSSSTSSQFQSKSWQPRVPMQSFLFGIKFKNRRKTKKSLQKQLSYIIEPKEPSG
ncbi:hypothetical protein GOBAR_AA12286 [Gossypium barbadense]|uniref:NAB domain-containing protein n=1 Tax=Gossypium barbadense TaxID=3634 RepID=A0A2P5XYD7_GOSBA|nr:hypothetical protein GOBAR_AA12286 [Gossypium barbadense]